jgi:hypothetical protein
MAVELAVSGVGVSAMAPGPVERGVNAIVELAPPSEVAVENEARWAAESVDYFRRFIPD